MTENPSATARRQSRFSGCMRCSNGFWQFRLDISLAGALSGANVKHQKSLLHPVDTALGYPPSLPSGMPVTGVPRPDRPAPPVPLCSTPWFCAASALLREQPT